jgi:hypothetical protein
MTIDFSFLKLIPTILEYLKNIEDKIDTNIEKRWLNSSELALYTGYKLETIKSKVKKGDFIQGLHYYKRDGKLLFDKKEIDRWVMGISKSVENNKELDKNNKDSESDTYISNIIEDIVSDIVLNDVNK